MGDGGYWSRGIKVRCSSVLFLSFLPSFLPFFLSDHSSADLCVRVSDLILILTLVVLLITITMDSLYCTDAAYSTLFYRNQP